jgi:hypothetical protein
VALAVEHAPCRSAARGCDDERAPAALEHRHAIDLARVGPRLPARIADVAECRVAIDSAVRVHCASPLAPAVAPEDEAAAATLEGIGAVDAARVVDRWSRGARVGERGEAVVAIVDSPRALSAAARTAARHLTPASRLAHERAVTSLAA